MKSRGWLVARILGLVLPLACSASAAPVAGTGGAGGSAGRDGSGGRGGAEGGGATGDGRSFVPEDLPATLQDGEQGVALKLVAFTLVQGATGPAFFAAVRNDGSAPSCNAGIMTEFFGKTGESLAMVGSALRGEQLYRLGSDTILNCIDPGKVGMSASTGFASDLVVETVSALKYRFPTFEVDGIEPLAGITVVQVATEATAGGNSYRGTLRNGLEQTVSNPSVTIFPLNRVGRPLGAGTTSATLDLPPGDTWSFETSAVSDVGVDFAVYPSASISN